MIIELKIKVYGFMQFPKKLEKKSRRLGVLVINTKGIITHSILNITFYCYTCLTFLKVFMDIDFLPEYYEFTQN